MKPTYGTVNDSLVVKIHVFTFQWQSTKVSFAYRAKKLQKQLDKTQLQLTECRAQIRDLKLQLSDAGDCKVSENRCPV